MTFNHIKLFTCLLAVVTSGNSYAQKSFVKVNDNQFIVNNKPYKFVGANYWFGGLLALHGNAGKARLKKELNFLKNKGINNLRVMVGAEGELNYKYRTSNKDALQPQQGVFKDSVMIGLDYFLNELNKREMKAILHFTNTWEWSGGLGMYLEWNGYGKQPLPKTEGYSWDKFRDYISQYYQCEPCKQATNNYIRYVLNRTNSISGVKYINDPSIMAWEIINEPRPMRETSLPQFLQWIKNTAALIKSIDPNHLLTTGSEGDIASDNNLDVFTQMHSDPNIDYLTIHIWPKNWGWFKEEAIAESMPTIITNARAYVKRHEDIAAKLNKPLVLEEFGLPRDNHLFDIHSSTALRNRFYKEMFNLADQSKVISGSNFWAFGGLARPIEGQLFWKEGDDYMGDPGGEEQGLNSVFITDKSTWKLIKTYTRRYK